MADDGCGRASALSHPPLTISACGAAGDVAREDPTSLDGGGGCHDDGRSAPWATLDHEVFSGGGTDRNHFR